ncbi:MAG: hypothetical protein J6T00_01795, partial [Bacteroidaceae bacterium]|nr:hypothetical protein [Bacteroidaceae bacterium]
MCCKVRENEKERFSRRLQKFINRLPLSLFWGSECGIIEEKTQRIVFCLRGIAYLCNRNLNTTGKMDHWNRHINYVNDQKIVGRMFGGVENFDTSFL